MASGVVKVGRRDYAVGLIWQPSPSGRVAQAAREAAQQPGQQSEFYCVRAASKTVAVPQYGLAQSQAGHKVGMPALAGSLANVQPGSWAGAFRLREGTWVVVVRDDLVAPDGDILFDNDDVARDRLVQEVALGGVQRVYAPEAWAVPGSDPTPLPLLLQDRVDCRLQPVQVPVKLLAYTVGGVAILGLLIFLGLQWQAEQEAREQEAERLRVEQEGFASGLNKQFQWPPAEQLYKRKWEDQPMTGRVVEACRLMFAKVDLVQLGWKRQKSTCQGNSVLVNDYVREQKKYGVLPLDATVKDDLGAATQTIKGDRLGPRGTEPLQGEEETNRRALAMNWPVAITRLPDEPPPPPPPDVKDPPPPPPAPWRLRGIKYSGKQPPWEIWGFFDGMPGLVVDKIIWEGGSWIVEATLYEKRGRTP